MTAQVMSAPHEIDDREYKRRIRAWTMYDWANSAFATTILAAVLPAYYSSVAGATLPSEAKATQYWSIGLSISLFIIAILSPILGTVSDIMRGKKKFLAVFVGLGVVGTGLLVLVDTGDWLLASIFFIVGRIGFGGANVFYDALLSHVAKEEDRDRVSTRGYALGYLGGGILLAVNIAMIQMIPGTLGARLSFLSVAIWWAVFSIPILRVVPEPQSASKKLAPGESLVAVSFGRIKETFKEIRQFQELFRFLVSFLIYNDGIGIIIGIAVIYGAELGFATVELVLALLLVQFVGIPFSLIFGNLPSKSDKRQTMYLAFVLFNIILLPIVGVAGMRFLPVDVTGMPPEPFATTATAVGEGAYTADSDAIAFSGDWERTAVTGEERGVDGEDAIYAHSGSADAHYDFVFNGQKVAITYSTGPENGLWAVAMDGQPLLDDDGQAIIIDGYSPTVRYDVSKEFLAEAEGEHTLSIINTGDKNPDSGGKMMALAQVNVLPPLRTNNLGIIVGLILALQVVGALFAFLLGPRLFSGLAERMDTKHSIILALVAYSIIAVWGFFLNAVIEFWFLAWMVAVVQGGSQALSRSMYASMSPPSMSGEFFGLFSIMSKFASFISPIFFIISVWLFDSSRPGILSIVILLIIGGYLLTRVDVDKGRRAAQEKEAELALS